MSYENGTNNPMKLIGVSFAAVLYLLLFFYISATFMVLAVTPYLWFGLVIMFVYAGVIGSKLLSGDNS